MDQGSNDDAEASQTLLAMRRDCFVVHKTHMMLANVKLSVVAAAHLRPGTRLRSPPVHRSLRGKGNQSVAAIHVPVIAEMVACAAGSAQSPQMQVLTSTHWAGVLISIWPLIKAAIVEDLGPTRPVMDINNTLQTCQSGHSKAAW